MDIEQNKINEASTALYRSLLKGIKDVAFNLVDDYSLVVKKKWKKVSFNFVINGSPNHNLAVVKSIPWPTEPADFSVAVAENITSLIEWCNSIPTQGTEPVVKPEQELDPEQAQDDEVLEMATEQEADFTTVDEVNAGGANLNRFKRVNDVAVVGEVTAERDSLNTLAAETPVYEETQENDAAVEVSEQNAVAETAPASYEENNSPALSKRDRKKKRWFSFEKKRDDEESTATEIALEANDEDQNIWGEAETVAEEPVVEETTDEFAGEIPEEVLDEMEQNDTNAPEEIVDDTNYDSDEDLFADDVNDTEEPVENAETVEEVSEEAAEEPDFMDPPAELEDDADLSDDDFFDENDGEESSETIEENELVEQEDAATGENEILSENNNEGQEVEKNIDEPIEDPQDDEIDLEDDDEIDEILEEEEKDMGNKEIENNEVEAEKVEAETAKTEEAINELALVAQSKLTDSQLGHMITKNTEDYVKEITAVFKNLVEMDHDIARRLYISAIVSCIKIYNGDIEAMCEKLDIDERDAIMANYEYQIMLLNDKSTIE